MFNKITNAVKDVVKSNYEEESSIIYMICVWLDPVFSTTGNTYQVIRYNGKEYQIREVFYDKNDVKKFLLSNTRGYSVFKVEIKGLIPHVFEGTPTVKLIEE